MKQKEARAKEQGSELDQKKKVLDKARCDSFRHVCVGWKI